MSFLHVLMSVALMFQSSVPTSKQIAAGCPTQALRSHPSARTPRSPKDGAPSGVLPQREGWATRQEDKKP
jgi:hypothetical protein